MGAAEAAEGAAEKRRKPWRSASDGAALSRPLRGHRCGDRRLGLRRQSHALSGPRRLGRRRRGGLLGCLETELARRERGDGGGRGGAVRGTEVAANSAPLLQLDETL